MGPWKYIRSDNSLDNKDIKMVFFFVIIWLIRIRTANIRMSTTLVCFGQTFKTITLYLINFEQFVDDNFVKFIHQKMSTVQLFVFIDLLVILNIVFSVYRNNSVWNNKSDYNSVIKLVWSALSRGVFFSNFQWETVVEVF